MAQRRVDQYRRGVQVEQDREHLGLERHPGVEQGLLLRGGLPARRGDQRVEVDLGAHRALLGGVATEQDGPHPPIVLEWTP